jgi:hypothetical protein
MRVQDQWSAEKVCAQAEQGGLPGKDLHVCKWRTSTACPGTGTEAHKSVKPTCREWILQGRVTKGEQIQLLCHKEALDGDLYEVRKERCPAARSHLWNPACPKARKPSQSQQGPLAIISGHPGTWLLTQQINATLLPNTSPKPRSKVH